VNTRNISGSEPLQPDMNDWTGAASLQFDGVPLGALEGAANETAAPTAEEAALIARARAGEQEAFGSLVRLHQRQVYALAYRMLRDQDEAAEATQEVFLAAWQGLRGFREEARFATWLYRIAYRHCLKVAASHKREVAARAELAATSAREQSAQQRDSARHAQAAAYDVRELVRDEIAGLPPKYRMALALRHFQELSYEEMAEVMRVPIGTVKTQLFRARALLKERLEGLGQDLERARDEGLAHAGGLRAGLEAGIRTVFDHVEHGRSPLRGGSDL